MPIARKHLAWGASAAAFAALLFVWLAPEPVPVETALATRGPIRVTVDEEGEIRAHDRYVVAAPVSGRLLRVELLDGDPVKEGEVVARIAPLPLTTREREELVAKVAAHGPPSTRPRPARSTPAPTTSRPGGSGPVRKSWCRRISSPPRWRNRPAWPKPPAPTNSAPPASG